MGNSSSKDSHHGARGSARSDRHDEADVSSPEQTAPPTITVYAQGSAERRGSRHDIPFLHVSRDRNAEASQRPKETRQEKEARRAERERQARLVERERSMREESVDGGYLVTLGTYTGPEDYSKPVVRQLQLERRLAPFWKGLNDHSDSWTEYQLVSAVRGLPIPAADEVPTDMIRSPTINLDNTLSIPQQTQTLSASASPATTPLSSSAPMASVGASPFFRGRSKTLAALTGSSRPAADLVPQEIQLSTDPYVNGLPIEAYLYREPGECPICFLYYPPYLNKTRCCDQPICSECFVQIKRPDPHPPEHEQPGQQRRPEEEAELLVSEVAACPFCVAPEFGITYEPPPFRRGLGYANQNTYMAKALSATSSQTSFQSGERRRTISISASAPEVVTTDRVRPDWAKKLADARAHVLRRSAAATALHNAAYVLGNQESVFRTGYGRRRRSVFIETTGSGSQTPDASGSSDLFPGRTSSRRNRVEDLEDLMMMEAIRLSLAAEEERKRKEDKEKAKEDKKKSKEAKKEAKQLDKLNKKHGGSSTSLYKTQSNDSTSTWATNSMARSTSNLGSTPAIHEESQGKGKAPLIVGRSRSDSTAADVGDAQRHLEESRSALQPAASTPIPMPGRRHPRQLSNASSIASSLIESAPDSYHGDSPNASGVNLHDGTPSAAGSLEPMLNFRSLAAMIDDETKRNGDEHMEHAIGLLSPEGTTESSPVPSPPSSITFASPRQQGESGESSTAVPVESDTAAASTTAAHHDAKTGVQVIEHGPYHEATQ